jgi:hypothetical protein
MVQGLPWQANNPAASHINFVRFHTERLSFNILHCS